MVSKILFASSMFYVNIYEISHVVWIESISMFIYLFLDVVGKFSNSACQGSDGFTEEKFDCPVWKPSCQLIHKMTVSKRVQQLMRAFYQLQMKYFINGKVINKFNVFNLVDISFIS